MIVQCHTANRLGKMRKKRFVISLPLKILKMHGHSLSGRDNQHLQRSRQGERRQSMDVAVARPQLEGMQRARKRMRGRLSMSTTRSMSRNMKKRPIMEQKKGRSQIGAKKRARKKVGSVVQARPATTIQIYLKTQKQAILNRSCPQKEKSRKKRKIKIYK
jgi:hypothetical protein